MPQQQKIYELISNKQKIHSNQTSNESDIFQKALYYLTLLGRKEVMSREVSETLI